MQMNIKLATASAALMFAVVPAHADQACTSDLFGTGLNYCQETHGTGDQVTAYDGLQFPGLAVTPTKPTVDEDGNASTTDKTFYGFAVPTAEAYGHDATAIGNGARVGRFVEAVEGSPATCSAGAVNEAGDGCVEEGADFTPAVEAVPAHTIPADSGTAVGARAVVEHEHSTAIGADAKTDKANQIVLGTKDDTVTAPGIASEKSKARQSGPIEVVTSDKDGNLATDGGQIFGRLDSLESVNASQGAAINAHSALLSEHAARLDKQARGLAIAMAMPDTWLQPNEKFAIAGGFGGFDSETALAFSTIARIDETWSLNAGLGADIEFKEFGWKVGARAGF